MLKPNRLLPLVLILLILIAFLINNDFGLGSGEGQTVVSDPASELRDTVLTSPINEEVFSDQVIEDTAIVAEEDTILSITDTVSAANSLDTLAQNVEDSIAVVADKAEEVSPYNVIRVSKQEGRLAYEVNGHSSDNLVALLSHLQTKKETLLKMSGNITYAEEKEVKDILEVKEIKFTEADF